MQTIVDRKRIYSCHSCPFKTTTEIFLSRWIDYSGLLHRYPHVRAKWNLTFSQRLHFFFFWQIQRWKIRPFYARSLSQNVEGVGLFRSCISMGYGTVHFLCTHTSYVRCKPEYYFMSLSAPPFLCSLMFASDTWNLFTKTWRPFSVIYVTKVITWRFSCVDTNTESTAFRMRLYGCVLTARSSCSRLYGCVVTARSSCSRVRGDCSQQLFTGAFWLLTAAVHGCVVTAHNSCSRSSYVCIWNGSTKINAIWKLDYWAAFFSSQCKWRAKIPRKCSL